MANIHRYEMPGDAQDYRVDPTVPAGNPVEMGDMVYWSAGDFFLKVLTAGNGPEFVGVAEGVGPTPTSNIDNVAGLVPSIRVRGKGVFRFKTTAADSLSHGDAMVVGADAQTVLKQTGEADTEIVGYVFNPQADAVVTGATGVNIDVLVAANFPAVGLI